MATLGPRDKLLLSEANKAEVVIAGNIALSDMGEVALRGRANGVRLFALEGEKKERVWS